MTTSDIDIATPEQLAPVLHAAIQRLGRLGRTGSLALAALVDSEDDDYNSGSFWIDSIAEGVSHSYFERRKGRAMWKLRYFANATRLLFKGNIRWVIYRKALREWPVAVAGKGGAYQLDPDFSDR